MVLQHTVQYHEARTESGSKASPSSPSRLISLSASCSSPSASSSKRIKKRTKQVSLPSPQCVTSSALSIHTDTLFTFPRCTKCGYSHPLTSAWLKAKNVITAAAKIITLPCAGVKDPSNLPMMPEA